MIIGILSARDRTYHPNMRLLEASRKRGHEARLIHPKHCRPTLADGRMTVEGPAPGPDALLPRIGATINDYALALIRHFELSGTDVINGFSAIALTRDKFLGLETLAADGIPVPRSILVSNPGNLEKAVDELGGCPVVVKALRSRQGKGVFLLEGFPEAADLLDRFDARNRGLLVQEYIPPANRLDVRLLAVGDRIPAALALTPQEGDFRANIHQNGLAHALDPEPALAELALRAKKVLGLDIAGVDIIIARSGDPWVIEVNYSPGFKGLEAVSGLDIAAEIIHYVERVHARKNGDR